MAWKHKVVSDSIRWPDNACYSVLMSHVAAHLPQQSARAHVLCWIISKPIDINISATSVSW